MKSYLCLFLLFLLVSQVFSSEPKLLEDFTTANRLFTAEAYRAVIEHASGNLLICPMAAEILLGLARFGAKENTAQELILHIQNSDEDTRNMFIQLNKKLYSNDKFILASANNIFLNNKYIINNEFKGIAYGDFKAGVRNLDFSRIEESIDYVNSWVEKRTHRKIKNFLSSGQLTADTSALFVSTMYFRGNWITQFDRKSTVRRKFYVNSQRTIETEMMSIESYFNYYDSKELDAQILQIPFEGDDITMSIVLPMKRFGLDNLEDRLPEALMPRNFKTVKIEIFIPKFTIESEIDFKPILQSMGIKDAFTNRADFSGISSCEPPLMIDEMFQKTFFEINEKGATSSASTAVVCTPLSLPQNTFNADHPFVFYVNHKTCGIIFIGKFVAPTV